MGNTFVAASTREDVPEKTCIPPIRQTGSRISQAPSLPTIEEENSTSSQIGDDNQDKMVKRSKAVYTSDAADMMMNLIDLRHQNEEKKVDDLVQAYRAVQETTVASQHDESYGKEDEIDEVQEKQEDLAQDTKKIYRVAYAELSENIEVEQIPEIEEVLSNENTRVITNSAYPLIIDRCFRPQGVLMEDSVKQEQIEFTEPEESNPIPAWEPQQPPEKIEEKKEPEATLVIGEQPYRGGVVTAPYPSAFDEEVDLEFVEQYDTAFNEFVAAHPNFLIHNPDLVHNLRVTKLQKCLERGDELEADLTKKVAEIRAQKSEMELNFQRKLKEASRMKAAREIHLKSSLDEFRRDFKVMQGRLTWDLVLSSQTRVQKLYDLRQHLKASETPTSWEVLLKMLPDDGPDAQAIRDAVLAPSLSSGTTTREQENDLRQFQVDNAFLNAEVSVLMKKLAYQKLAAKKHAWVETALLKMDPKAVRKLKARYQKKLGVAIP